MKRKEPSSPGSDWLPVQIIKRKRQGERLPEAVLKKWIQDYVHGQVPEYQMSAFLMAVYFQGLSESEIQAMMEAIMESGTVLDWKDLPTVPVDKHSTGGVGDKTSLILGPIVAAAGLAVPMMSGRGLGHTGGTLDKLESIPGFRTNLGLEETRRQVMGHHLAFIGQTEEICTADKKLYALRDVTATVENIGLITASIMSKKLAEGIQGLVLDVKYGSGAFLKTLEEARALARSMRDVGRRFKKNVVALITDMNQPLGRFSGNALEVRECLEIMEGKTSPNAQGLDLYADTRKLSLELAAHTLMVSGRWTDLSSARAKVKEILEQGLALAKFKEICRLQGGDLEALPEAREKRPILADRDGFVQSFDVEGLGFANIQLGAGRTKVDDPIDPSSGFELHVKLGSPVKFGDPLFTLHGSDKNRLQEVSKLVAGMISITDKPPAVPALIAENL